MNAEYQTVFEVTQKGFAWWFPAAGLIFLALGATQVRVGQARGWPRVRIWFAYSITAFGALWFLLMFTTMYAAYYKLRRAYRNGQYSIVEGDVENFRPMPYQGHQDERFTLKGVAFCYSDDGLTPGFNNTSSHGGPVRPGLRVRIAYIDGDILRLEVKTDQAPSETQRAAYVAAAKARWEKEETHESLAYRMRVGLLLAAVFLTLWCNIQWRRFIDFWLHPPYRCTAVIGFRLFFAACLAGTVGGLVHEVASQPLQPIRTYVDAVGICGFWIFAFCAIVQVLEWLARKSQRSRVG